MGGMLHILNLLTLPNIQDHSLQYVVPLFKT